MSESVSSVVNRCCDEHKKRMGAYRALNNDRYSHEDLICRLQDDCGLKVSSDEHVLCIQDTTEFDFHHINKRLHADGPDLGKGSTHLLMRSFFLHPTLVVNADTSEVKGFGSIEIYNRAANLDKPMDPHKREFKDKEDYRWVSSAKTSAATLPEGTMKTIVCDREGDAFDIMRGILDSGCEFLIRSHHDRKDLSEQDRLRKSVASTPLIATYH